jgi:hypothetical protein
VTSIQKIRFEARLEEFREYLPDDDDTRRRQTP